MQSVLVQCTSSRTAIFVYRLNPLIVVLMMSRSAPCGAYFTLKLAAGKVSHKNESMFVICIPKKFFYSLVSSPSWVQTEYQWMKKALILFSIET